MNVLLLGGGVFLGRHLIDVLLERGHAVTTYTRGVRAVLERRGARYTVTYPDGRRQTVPVGLSVLDASRMAGIPHASICGGRGRCTLCRVRLLGAYDLPPPGPVELRLLRRLDADPATVRQACQIRPAGDISVMPMVPAGAAERR